MEKNENEKIELVPGNQEIITFEEAEDLISIAQRRVDIVDKLIEYSLKSTTERDWVNQGGNPYLVHSGAEKVARLFGIKLSNIKTEKEISEDTKGKYYIYKTTGTASLPGKYDSIEAIGTCSQRDKFWAFSSGNWKETIEIDETNILKASYTNFVVNSITHLLGLRNITWDLLQKAGIDVTKIQKVEYKKGTQKVEKTLSKEAVETRRKIYDMALQMAGGAEEEVKALIKKHSSFAITENGVVKDRFVEDVKQLTTEKWILSTYGRMKKAFEKQSSQETLSLESEEAEK